MPGLFKPVGDLIELSDMFRRAAAFEQHGQVEKLVSLTHMLGCQLTNYYGEYAPDNPVNRNVLGHIAETLAQIDRISGKLGLEKITLPLAADNPLSGIISDNVLAVGNYTVSFDFRTEDYNKDLSPLGPIQPDIRTFLDQGIRGLVPLGEIIWRWDGETPDEPRMMYA